MMDNDKNDINVGINIPITSRVVLSNAVQEKSAFLYEHFTP